MKYIRYLITAALAALLFVSCGRPAPDAEMDHTTSQAVTIDGVTDSMTASATTAVPDGVKEEYALAASFEHRVTHIVITNGMTGAQYTVLEQSELDRIAAFCEPIYGTEPQSNRGYYGFYYSITLYSGPISQAHIIFMIENLPGEAVFATGIYEKVNGHEYPVRYRMQGVTTQEVRDFFARYFPANGTTTAESEVTTEPADTAIQNPPPLINQMDNFDYSSLPLPDYRTQNPVRYLGVDERGLQTNGWQDFGSTGELRTVPQPMGSTYIYQTYSYFIRNDLTHLYPVDPLPSTPGALAEWLTDFRAVGRQALWYSMGEWVSDGIELSAYEELPTESGVMIGKATYRIDGKRWVVYLLCEENTASAFAIRPNEEGDYVISFTDSIAKSYQSKTKG